MYHKAQVELSPSCLGIQGQVKNGCQNSSRNPSSHGTTPPEGICPVNWNVGNSLTPLLCPPEKRDPANLFSGFSSTFLWHRC
ncbi:hypothetical protein AVEN_54507-1 [Araneus ventricosus]|uniref:Uncharacterized protein n=1 Tax=Araneus ventricosus TaxID=182803 RepID=A0A4Y2EL43_ARAVE|nr:hypothetical protein AVEN_54507-1 [Araneus ventricosus]